MKIQKIIIRALILAICFTAVIFQVFRISKIDMQKDKWKFVIGVSVPVLLGWSMIDGIRSVIRKTDEQPGIKKYSSDLENPEEAVNHDVTNEEYKNSLFLAAGILSDDDPEVMKLLGNFESGGGGVHFDENEDQNMDFFEAFLLSLDKGGFVGLNDWKFSLEDFIFNSRPALNYYGIDHLVYEKIKGKNEIFAPEAFQEIKRGLPEEYGVGIINHDSDTYYVVVAPQEKLIKADELMRGVGEGIYIVKLGVVEEI